MQSRSTEAVEDILKFNEVGRLALPASGVPRRRLALGIGVFDGVHRGHQAIVRELVELAHRTGAVPAALTFDPHPRAVLHPDEPPTLLIPLRERVRLLRTAGAEVVWVARFTPEFAALEPGEFLDRLLGLSELKLTGICVGEHWRFGRCGAGDCGFLRNYCAKRGVELSACPEVTLDGETVSSSAIRLAVATGRLDRAAAMLGRRYRLFGVVEHGYRVASGKLECPTANLSFSAGVLPPDGVYAAAVRREGRIFPAAVNVGECPTFGYEQAIRRVEAHLLDFSGNLYGSELEVEFLDYLREERTFAGAEELRAQIGRDLNRIRQLFSTYQEEEEN